MPENYDLKSAAPATIAAPALPYEPPAPKSYRPRIGLIGCGGITEHHLKAYRAAGWDVIGFCDHKPAHAERRRDEYYPQAQVYATADELLANPAIDVVDIATHPAGRAALIEQAIAARKHVLSQKPFVVDLAEGTRLVALARAAGVKLAVNLNGRWAPHFAYLRQAVRAGWIGSVSSVHIAINWDHTWTAGTAFEELHHLVLYDFGIHWFDAAYSLFGGTPARSVYATVQAAAGQPIKPPLVAASIVTFASGVATLSFNGWSPYGPQESCTVVGSKGTLRASGNVCGVAAVELITGAGAARAELKGSWFPDGFRGTMGELLCAIEEDREPENSAADNLRSLALCLGAVASADQARVIALAAAE